MTPEQQRIAIAKACGWTRCHCTGGVPNGLRPRFVHEENSEVVPDYLNDLNAIHEAEEVVLDNGGTWTRYVAQLKIQSAKSGIPHFHLDAAQRAEAFLKTLNLWTS